ncbi:PadR family transcriptional regulator [Bacillus cereus]|uniref:PadR family transcriptional regulator n=1 Tax=Bacillus paranthracis TaxID=2026186 RepID=A0A5M9GWP9_9BACI|nr:PadR family transcriptional regulator [Bacillus sp. FDAARGOS_527]KAA8478201.1 PadR family transcriptional regulator [Bacillus paranthracis]KAB7633974.1 PadR family transcriptional regulator [Bacillus sp. B4-WWTP-NA-D-NA-NA]PKF98862.1 PadR family transcriptional regulator [Bacillus cereus]PNS32819.1 PadR family transcriptional regulator [Bacillus sp. AKBS9]
MSKRRYIKIIADIIGVTVDIFEKSPIYLEGY